MLLILCAFSTTANQQRTALVIGNTSYRHLPPLMNPVNDATDMSVKLKSLGFEVISLLDATQEQMDVAVDQFGQRLKTNGGVGLFFYAGHGVQVGGHNYLIPVDAKLTKDFLVKYQALSADLLLDVMGDAANPMNIVILDACRDNPFVSSNRSLTRGLARMNAPTGSIIAYATGKGKVAEDGEERNSPYTGNLLNYIDQPGLSLEQVFKRVRKAVRKQTGKRQTPWEENSLIGDFYFVDAVDQPDHQAQAVELAYWNSIKNEQAPAYFSDYLSIYGNSGVFSSIARRKLSGLQSSGQQQDKTTAQATSHNSQQTTRLPYEPDMVYIRGGSFQMGSPESEKGHYGDEHLHTVIVQDFWMGKTEVTFAQYDVFVQQTGRKKPDDGGWGRGNRPVINVNWHDAVAYADWLSKQTRKHYRLPTEAEWEYAARAGTQTAYPWGHQASHEHANYGRDKCCAGLATGRDQWVNTAPVGQFPANDFGLHDMHGNVLEWTCSAYDGDYNGDERQCIDQAPARSRVLRGGGWIDDGRILRSAGRDADEPGDRGFSIGFRLAGGDPQAGK